MMRLLTVASSVHTSFNDAFLQFPQAYEHATLDHQMQASATWLHDQHLLCGTGGTEKGRGSKRSLDSIPLVIHILVKLIQIRNAYEYKSSLRMLALLRTCLGESPNDGWLTYLRGENLHTNTYNQFPSRIKNLLAPAFANVLSKPRDFSLSNCRFSLFCHKMKVNILLAQYGNP